MQEPKHHRFARVIDLYTRVYQYLVWVFGFVIILNAGGGIAASFAADKDLGAFSVLVCNLFSLMAGIIISLAVITIIAAGIVYATSQGASGGINSAKTMIVSALSGIALYALAGYFLGACGDNGVANSTFFRNILPQLPSASDSAEQ
ncbi:MAG: hypothetical protein R3B38_02610 [Patescibacteria group bacterium]